MITCLTWTENRWTTTRNVNITSGIRLSKDKKKYNYPEVITEKMAAETIDMTHQHVLNIFSEQIGKFMSEGSSVQSLIENGQTHLMRKALFVKVRNDIIGISYELKAVLGPVPEPSDEEKENEDWDKLDE